MFGKQSGAPTVTNPMDLVGRHYGGGISFFCSFKEPTAGPALGRCALAASICARLVHMPLSPKLRVATTAC
jgi:hypothetical protein